MRHPANAGLGMPARAAEAAARPAAKSETAMPQPVERASAEDCAIIGEIGKAKMNWGATPPEFASYPEFNRAGGRTYLEDCPWEDLGVADPLIETPTSKKAFFISRPVYSGMHASADIEKRHITQSTDRREKDRAVHRNGILHA
jgi:hypothetical protein